MKTKSQLIALFLLIFTPCFATDRAEELINHVQNCLNQAEQSQSKLLPEILEIQGMSGTKFRHFLNNLCTLPSTSYLEIGCWTGSTLVSALYGNNERIQSAIAIDNWSQFQRENPHVQIRRNIAKYAFNAPLRFIEQDCFTVALNEVFSQPVNIYFYDGAHEFADQEKAFTYFNLIFDDVFIAVVDDWNHPPAREGTKSAFKKLNYTVLQDWEIHTERNGVKETWWNGMYVAVIKK